MSEETLEEGTFKVKLKKPKQLSKQDKTIKVDLSKPKEKGRTNFHSYIRAKTFNSRYRGCYSSSSFT